MVGYPETGFGEMWQLNVSIGADLREADSGKSAMVLALRDMEETSLPGIPI